MSAYLNIYIKIMCCMKENTKNVKLCAKFKWNRNKTMNLEIKGCGLDVGKVL